MDKFQALDAFWSSFGLDAYDSSTVPTGENKPDLPYITYDAYTSNFGNPVSLAADLWYYGSWIRQGQPFAQRMADPDDMIRRITMNYEAEFLTAD